LGSPGVGRRRDTAADTEFGISGDLSGFAFGCATVCAHVVHVARERRGRPCSMLGQSSGAQGAPFLWPAFKEALGGNWGYTDVHDIGNSGKDG
jgi:hypothetical protein